MTFLRVAIWAADAGGGDIVCACQLGTPGSVRGAMVKAMSKFEPRTESPLQNPHRLMRFETSEAQAHASLVLLESSRVNLKFVLS
jgi:hypothetical protein